MRAELQQRQDSRRAFRWLLVSIALHLPLTPLGPLFGLVALLTRCSEPPPPVEALVGIPVELLQDAPREPDRKDAVEPPTPTSVDSEPAPTVPKKPKAVFHKADALDAGAPADGGIEPFDAGADAAAPIAKAEDAGASIAQGPSPEESLSAATQGIANSNANVRLSIYMNRIRKQPLGTDLGRLLKSVYQWRDFFEVGGIDPVKDLDQIMLFGPQLRDSSQVAAFLQTNVRAPRMRAAIDALVKRPGQDSGWIKDSKYPAARAYADRAERTIVMYPNQIVAVVPPGVEKQALTLSGLKLPGANAEELGRAVVKTPWRALLGTGFGISKSIRSANLSIFAEDDGGARVEAVLDDESAEAANKNAKQLQRDVDSVTLASNWLLSGSRFAEPVQASVDGSKIKLVLKVTRAQAERIFSLAEAALTPEGRQAARTAIRAALSDAGARPAPSTPASTRTDTAPPASAASTRSDSHETAPGTSAKAVPNDSPTIPPSPAPSAL